jgi:DNA-binding FrmR family transcriptional regulator
MTSSADDCPDCAGPRRVARADKAALLKRLARLEGQVRAVRDMVASDRYCVDVITQIQAVRSALAAVAEQLLEDHLKGCVTRAVQQGDGEAELNELMGLLRRFR